MTCYSQTSAHLQATVCAVGPCRVASAYPSLVIPWLCAGFRGYVSISGVVRTRGRVTGRLLGCQGGGPIDYPSTATIPPCPLEAPQEAMPHRKVPIIPFLPQDPWDAESQNLRMYNAGVLLPELVDVSRALAFQKKMEAASVAQLPP